MRASPAKDIMTVQADGTTNGRHGTLISRQWHVVLPLSLLLYIILQVIISHQNGSCIAIDTEPFSDWTRVTNVIVASCFLLLFVQNIISMSFFLVSLQKGMQHPRSVYGAAATITLIAGISSILSFTVGSRHICKDALGIETYRSQWADWMVTVPLLAYVTIAIEDKCRLTREDKLALVSTFLMIFFGFAMNFVQQSPVYGWCLFTLSGICSYGLLRMALRSRRKAHAVQAMMEKASTSWQVERSIMKYRLSFLLVLVVPTFLLVYLLRYAGIISRYG
jgi:hypothetical protein